MDETNFSHLSPTIIDIVSEVEERFGSRIVCLLYYGSRAFGGNASEQSDHDFYLLLQSEEADDILAVRSIVQRYPILDFSIHYEECIRRKGITRFQHGNHGAFFACYLAISQCLIGRNVFCEIAETLSPAVVRQSLLFQIEEYFWRLNRWFLYEEHTDELFSRMKKYIMRIVIDMMLYHGDLPYECVSTYGHRELFERYAASVPYISDQTKSAMWAYIINPEVTRSTVMHLSDVQRLLYGDYIRFAEKDMSSAS